MSTYLCKALSIVVLGLLVGGRAQSATEAETACLSLNASMLGQWPDVSSRIAKSSFVPPGVIDIALGMKMVSVPVPQHCEVVGVMYERETTAHQHYAIRFHLRLPNAWNHRFLFQGGGGTNGELGDAIGFIAPEVKSGLEQGYAVVSQDAGHDNQSNNVPAFGGLVAFGHDPQARADYGYASLEPVALAAKAIVRQYYGRAPAKSYFMGCSKGGEEGLVFAERYPQEFDGILAAAPGMSLPRAAIAQAWDVKTFAAVIDRQRNPANATQLSPLYRAFSDLDLALVSKIILDVCDMDDGLSDGMVQDFRRCTTARVLPALGRSKCSEEKTPGCLSQSQIRSLRLSHEGPHDSKGRALYSDWAWDAGIAGPGWRFWKLGTADGHLVALNIPLGGASLAAVFTTPPTVLASDLQSQWNFLLAFNYDRDAPKIYATNNDFRASAWDEVSARSSDLTAFNARGGKLIIPQGVSDPVFSINDTLSWWHDVDRRSHGAAANFVRVFPVPGMAHCQSGPATDQYDALTALVDWVERRKAPENIFAIAGAAAPWPGRSRPLCAYPTVARYVRGNIERAESFSCI